jgi:hypothetical protein
MEKKLKNYLVYISEIKNPDNGLKGKLLIQIGFFQHERLIHFLVTMLFSFLTVVCLICSFLSNYFGLYIIDILLLIVMIFYIKHYYYLENGVQQLYNEYDRLFDKR